MLSQLTCFQRTWNSANKDSLSWIQRHWSIQDEISIRQTPGANLNRLVLDGGRRDADVELVVFDDAVLDQILNRAFVLLRVNKEESKLKNLLTILILKRSTKEIFLTALSSSSLIQQFRSKEILWKVSTFIFTMTTKFCELFFLEVSRGKEGRKKVSSEKSNNLSEGKYAKNSNPSSNRNENWDKKKFHNFFLFPLLSLFRCSGEWTGWKCGKIKQHFLCVFVTV